MQVILADGPKRGEYYELSKNVKDNSIFPVILTEDHKYAYAEYIIVPARTRLDERMAKLLRMVER